MRWFGLVTSTIHGFHFKTFIFCHVYIERRHGSEVSENRKPLERLESPAVFLQCGRTELTQSSSAISPAKRASEVAVCGFTEGIPFLIDAYLVLHKYSEVHKETDKQSISALLCERDLQPPVRATSVRRATRKPRGERVRNRF